MGDAIRESLDQRELMCDLAALGFNFLLRILELLGGSLRLESDVVGGRHLGSVA